MRTVIFEVRPWSATSVWRRIECTERQTLFDLHVGIQRAFELDGDHGFAFYLNNRVWDRVHEYGGDDARHDADEEALRDLRLPLNKRILYLFDFGAEHRHEVKVVGEAIAESGVEYPRVVGGEGDAPPQYEDYDEEDGDAEDVEQDDEPVESADADADDAPAEDQPSIPAPLLAILPLLKRAVAPYTHRDDLPEDDERRAHAAEPPPPLVEQLSAARAVLEQHDVVQTIRALEGADVPLRSWFRGLPGQLSEAGMHREALELNAQVGRIWPGPLGVFELPPLLARAGERDQALAKVDENLREYPDDPDMLLRAAVALDLLGETKRAGAAFRDALTWAGSSDLLRGRIVDAHAAMLERAGRGSEVLTLRRAERNQREADRRERLRELGVESPIVRETPKVGANEPCPCGSGKKYKKCCGAA